MSLTENKDQAASAPKYVSPATIAVVLAGLFALGIALTLVFGEISQLRPDAGPEALLSCIKWALPMAAFALILTSSYARRIPAMRRLQLTFVTGPLKPVFEKQSLALVLGIAVLSGLGEEVLFRGFLQQKIGYVFAAIIFGLMHLTSPLLFAIVLPLGFYFGWAYLETHNILVPIAAHAVLNFVTFWRYLGFYREIQEASTSKDLSASRLA